MDYHIQLELWRGNVAGAIQIARQRNELSDWIVAMAPLASHDLWELVSAEYAEQLEEDGQYHKAATYLLAAHKVHQAIDLFRRHRLFKEAVSLARIRLSAVDPLLEDLYTEWGQNLMKDGQFEQAAKCYLAMRHVQEAGKALTRRHDQSSLRTACHMTLLSNEKQQGLVYAYRLFTQHLIMGEWQEAYKFVGEHESLKVLLPLLNTHELLVQQLTSLCPSLTLTQKPLTPDMFSQWEKKEISKSKTGLPEFLIDKSEIDPVVPWDPFLIGEHTFPHHLLRVWHQHLDITMATPELKAMHSAISQLVTHRQTLVDLPNTLLVVSVDVTLCLLALLIAETSSAINHLLQALSYLQQGNHKSLLQAVCRLILPQGPKYLLKLQQEFNASRVLITMESLGDVAGGENHNTIKKFLTDIKEDNSISMSSVRCRELDCLRAYYYLAVLDYFRDSYHGGLADNDSHDGMPNGISTTPEQSQAATAASESVKKDLRVSDDSKSKESGKSAMEGVMLESSPRVSSLDFVKEKKDVSVSSEEHNLADLDQNGKLSCVESSSPPPGGETPSTKVKGGPHLNSMSSNCDTNISSNDKLSSSGATDTPNQKPPSNSQEPGTSKTSSPSASSSSSVLPPVPKLSMTVSDSSSVDPPFVPSTPPSWKTSPSHKSTSGASTPQTKSALASPSSPLKPTSPSSKTEPNSSGKSPASVGKQSKSSAEKQELLSPSHSSGPKGQLTNKNLLRLSKGILWDIQGKREALTETLGYIHRAISQHLLANRSVSEESLPADSDAKDPGSLSPTANIGSKSLHRSVDSELEQDGGCHQGRLFPDGSKNNLTISPSSPTISLDSLNLDRARSLSPQLVIPMEDPVRRGPYRSLSENYASPKGPLSPSAKLEHSVALHVEQELLGSLTNEPVSLQKSRKVLWRDGKESCSGTESISPSPAAYMSKISPDGSTIPLEWDDLPVDVKYMQPYVTLPLLRQEQENISLELKRVPDASKISFPGTNISIRRLLETSLSSPHLSKEEKHSYFKQLNDWAALFAVTTHQQHETEALFATAATENFSDM